MTIIVVIRQAYTNSSRKYIFAADAAASAKSAGHFFPSRCQATPRDFSPMSRRQNVLATEAISHVKETGAFGKCHKYRYGQYHKTLASEN